MTVPLAKQINCIEFVIHNGDPSWRRLPDLRAVLATLQQHERAMAVVDAARQLQALRYGEAEKETLDQFKALDALDIALAALDGAANTAGDAG
jgi:hypothetical protein